MTERGEQVPDIPDNQVRLEYITSCSGGMKEKIYLFRYLKSRNLKKEDLKKREHTKSKENLIHQLRKRSNFSKRKIAILMGVNRETVRKMSEEPSP